MAIRRISELDILSNITDDTLEEFLKSSTINTTNVEYDNDYKIDGFYKYVFEVSEFDGQNDAAPSYYISKQISYQNLSKILTFPLYKSIQNVVTADIPFTGDKIFKDNVYISGVLDVTNLSTSSLSSIQISSNTISAIDANLSNIICNNLTSNYSISCGGTIWCNYLHALSAITCNNLTATGNIKCDNDISCNKLYGIATSAYWADLAEMYESDYDYEPGTLVKFGGQKEITVADYDVNAVITTSPGLVLNSGKQENKLMKGIALVGRVPVKVIGEIQKFDNITLSKQYPGYATKASDIDKIIGKALETNYSHDCKLVECVVKMTF